MAIDRNTFLEAFGTTLGVDIITGALANLIVYGVTLGVPKIFVPDYQQFLIGVIIAIIIGMALAIGIRFIPKECHVKLALALGIIIGIVMGMVASPFPLFEITSPTDNSAVDHIISVRGHGGIPNSKIQVFVITDYLYPQNITHPDATGKWSIFPVYIGEEHHYGLEAEIYAEMTTPDGKIYRSNFIKVKRKCFRGKNE